MQRNFEGSINNQRNVRSMSLSQDVLHNSYVSYGGQNSLYTPDGHSDNLFCGTPPNPSNGTSLFSFDNFSNAGDFPSSPFRCTSEVYPSGNDLGNFSRFGQMPLSSFDDDSINHPDPFYLPSFRNADAFSSREVGLSPSLQRRVAHPAYSSFPQLNQPFSDGPLFTDDTLRTPTLFPSSLSSHPLSSPSYSRPAAGSEPSLYDSQFTYPSSPMKPMVTASSPLKQHNSPQRPRKLATGRNRGGSPDPSNELKIEDVISGKDKRTTLMIKNIPNAFTRETLLGIVDQVCKDEYDYFYLPIDQKTNCNLGYGYINMLSIESVIKLYNELNNKTWQNTRSVKVCSICYGRLQSGTENLAQYCSDWSVMTSDKKYHPLFFREVKEVVDGQEVRHMERYSPEINLSMKTTQF